MKKSSRKLSLRELLQIPPDYLSTLLRRSDKRSIKEFFQFRCSPQWVATGAITSILSGAALLHRPLRVPVFVGLSTLGVTGAAYATLIEPRRPVLERVTIALPSLPPALDGLRIGHLTDFHLDFPHTRSNVQWAVQRMHEEHPDLLVITGDFVSFARAIPLLPDLLQPLQAPLGIYAVPGNHDHWEGVDDIRAQTESQGIIFLMNTSKRLSWRGSEFWLAGVDDMWYGQPDLDTALSDIPEHGFTILLAHPPDYADIAAQRPIALQLSGHTHGGHMHLPLLGWFCVPYHGFRYISGLFQAGSMHLYVSRGLGGMPMRMGCPPEATILTLRQG